MSELNRTLFRREKIGFIFQFFNLIPTLTCLENVCLPLELNAMSPSKTKSRAIELLTAVGLSDRLSTFPEDLSGGEQQRVAIARALVHDPLLVLADEPTGNLDEDTGNQIMSLLDRLTRKAGKNLIMVTHNLDVAALADRTLYLKDGNLLTNESSVAHEIAF
jgi:putative ABC transport system ATP-binding protein